MPNKKFKERVFDVVKATPKDRVTWFGAIASEVGIPPLVVGWILSGMTDAEMELIPWERVVAKNGFISSLKLGLKGELQRTLLLQQGFEIIDDHVSSKHFWPEL